MIQFKFRSILDILREEELKRPKRLPGAVVKPNPKSEAKKEAEKPKKPAAALKGPVARKLSDHEDEGKKAKHDGKAAKDRHKAAMKAMRPERKKPAAPIKKGQSRKEIMRRISKRGKVNDPGNLFEELLGGPEGLLQEMDLEGSNGGEYLQVVNPHKNDPSKQIKEPKTDVYQQGENPDHSENINFSAKTTSGSGNDSPLHGHTGDARVQWDKNGIIQPPDGHKGTFSKLLGGSLYNDDGSIIDINDLEGLMKHPKSNIVKALIMRFGHPNLQAGGENIGSKLQELFGDEFNFDGFPIDNRRRLDNKRFGERQFADIRQEFLEDLDTRKYELFNGLLRQKGTPRRWEGQTSGEPNPDGWNPYISENPFDPSPISRFAHLRREQPDGMAGDLSVYDFNDDNIREILEEYEWDLPTGINPNSFNESRPQYNSLRLKRKGGDPEDWILDIKGRHTEEAMASDNSPVKRKEGNGYISRLDWKPEMTGQNVDDLQYSDKDTEHNMGKKARRDGIGISNGLIESKLNHRILDRFGKVWDGRLQADGSLIRN